MSLESVRSFTLIEMLVVLIIAGLIMGALMLSFWASQNSYLSAGVSIQVQQEARRALDAMVRELREAGPPCPATGPPCPSPSATIIQLGRVPINPNPQRLDFQIAQGYNQAGCLGTICWGDGTTVGQWVHYVLDTTTFTAPPNVRLMRCPAAAAGLPGRDEAMPPGGSWASCRVLANNVDAAVNPFFAVNAAANVKTVTINLRTLVTSNQLAGGSMASSASSATPITTQVRLRN